MRPQADFIAERPLANHAPELLASGTPAPDPAASLAQFGEALCAPLAQAISRLCAPGVARVKAGVVRECGIDTLLANDDALASHCLMELEGNGATCLLSIGGGPVLSLFDRTFGGTGKIAEHLPDAFPLSAEIFIRRLDAMMIEAIAAALGPCTVPAVRALRQADSLSKLRAFAPDEHLLELVFDVSEDGAEPWPLAFICPVRVAAALVDDQGDKPRCNAQPGPASPMDAPFAAVPLTMRAQLVDMRIAFSRLAELRPGDVLPVAIARSVPLKLRDRTIAYGTVGEMDDRVALSITQAF